MQKLTLLFVMMSLSILLFKWLICKLLCNNRLLKKCLLKFNKLALLFELMMQN